MYQQVARMVLVAHWCICNALGRGFLVTLVAVVLII